MPPPEPMEELKKHIKELSEEGQEKILGGNALVAYDL